ncbi:MAG: hypothetical protein JOZ51_08225 [Chloroflexi bacterium]|nr:hypothetical protein [Chloroflexota bacterium]
MGSSLTIDELDTATTEWIAEEAQRAGVSEETIVRQLIYRGIEAERKRAAQQIHNDLDTLAGTWDAEEAAEFLQVVEDFGQVDRELWQ